MPLEGLFHWCNSSNTDLDLSLGPSLNPVREKVAFIYLSIMCNLLFSIRVKKFVQIITCA